MISLFSDTTRSLVDGLNRLWFPVVKKRFLPPQETVRKPSKGNHGFHAVSPQFHYGFLGFFPSEKPGNRVS